MAGIEVVLEVQDGDGTRLDSLNGMSSFQEFSVWISQGTAAVGCPAKRGIGR
jgi:hypothetical protein